MRRAQLKSFSFVLDNKSIIEIAVFFAYTHESHKFARQRYRKQRFLPKLSWDKVRPMLTISNPNITLRQKAYEIIQKRLLNGEIRAGDLVSEMALAEEIGMSRTPVREAIGQLELEGLFDKVPRVGTLVRLPKQRELAELYGVREALEGFVTSLAVNSLTGQQFLELESHQAAIGELIRKTEDAGASVLDASGLVRFFDADIRFHAVIIGTTDNQHLLKIINEFRVVQRVFEYGRMFYDLALIRSAMDEHEQILAALKNGDSIKARNTMGFHIRSSCAHAMRHFETVDVQSNSSKMASFRADTDVVHSRLKQRPRRHAVVLNT